MGWHTDARPTPRRKDQDPQQAPGSPVLTLNLFEDFLFCTVPIKDGGLINKQMELVMDKVACVLLKHGDAMIWPAVDDNSHTHSVAPPPGRKSANRLRVSIVYRYSNPRRPKRQHESDYPYRESVTVSDV